MWPLLDIDRALLRRSQDESLRRFSSCKGVVDKRTRRRTQEEPAGEEVGTNPNFSLASLNRPTGMSWFPLLEGGGDDDHQDAPPNAPPATSQTQLPGPSSDDPLLPPPLGSPLDHELSFLSTGGFTASPSEGCGRPLTAPPGDRTPGMTRPRPGRREGLGRPMSATPSDKSFGMRRMRPGKSEGFGRPVTALPSDHSRSGSPAWGSPHGFRCEESTTPEDARARRPATAPALRRQSSSNLSGSRHENGAFGERFGPGGSEEVDEETGGGAAVHHRPMPDGDGLGEDGRAVDSDVDWGWCGVGPARECWA